MSERNVIELELGKPQLLTLEFDSPLETAGQYGPRYGYKCNETEILFVDEAAKLAIDRTGARRGNTISLLKTKNGRNNVWKAELAKSDSASNAYSEPKQAAQPAARAATETEVERARRLLAEAEAKEAIAQKQQEQKATERPAQSYPLAEQFLPFLRGAIIATFRAESEAKQNNMAVEFNSEDIRAFAITLYIEYKKAAR